jgi:hypothetical protein
MTSESEPPGWWRSPRWVWAPVAAFALAYLPDFRTEA